MKLTSSFVALVALIPFAVAQSAEWGQCEYYRVLIVLLVLIIVGCVFRWWDCMNPTVGSRSCPDFLYRVGPDLRLALRALSAPFSTATTPNVSL